MQKTFNVWVMAKEYTVFTVCSKVVNILDGLEKIDVDDDIVADGSDISGCDVSQWLETLNLDEGEVIGGQITFKFKNK